MKKLLTVLILVVFAAWNSYGLVATSYQFAQGNAAYTAITGGTVLGTGTIDDVSYSNNPIGFTFNYNSVDYTAFSVNCNGFLALGTTVSSSYSPLSSGSTNNVISVLGGDLQGNTTTGDLRYQVLGTAPNRVLVVQWTSFRNYGASGQDYNFQIRLSETTNKVTLHYGSFTTNASTYTLQVGMRGAASTDYLNRTTATNWSATTAGVSNTATCTVSSTVLPASGLYFEYGYVAPLAATNVSPTNGQIDVPRNTTLNWAANTGGAPTSGYILYLGTDNPPTNVVNGIDLGLVTSYDPIGNLLATTTYYWRVDAYNVTGGTTAGSVWSFTTLTPSIISGWVRNSALNPIIGAEIFAGAYYTTTGAGGAYELELVPGTYNMVVQADGYNTGYANGVVVVLAQTTEQNFTLTSPTMSITPNPFNVTVNPNELYIENMYILNQGTGPLNWTALLTFPPTDGDNMAATGTTTYPLLSEILAASSNGTPSVQVPNSPGLATQPAPNAPTNVNTDALPGDMSYAYVAYGGSSSLTEGPCKFALNAPGAITRFGGAASNFINSGDWVDDTWYGKIYGVNGLIKVDMTTGAVTNLGGNNANNYIAYNWDDQTMYALNYYSGASQLAKVDLTTGNMTAVGSAGSDGFICFTIDNFGQGYAVNINTDQFGKIDLATGAWTPVASVGFDASYAQSMTYDHSDNTIYWAAYDAGGAGGELLKVDGVSGTITFVGAFPGGAEMTGMMVPNKPAIGWFRLETNLGTVTPFTNYALPAYFDATGLLSGTVKTCTATFSSDPNVGTWTIPVTMTVQGTPLGSPTNLEATLINMVTGEVSVTWDPAIGSGLLHYLVKRDGVQVGIPTGTSFNDFLPTYGTYNYTVQAVYADGAGTPAGPVEVVWPNPTLSLNPTSLTATVWTNTSKDLNLGIGNTGEGVLTFDFPDYSGPGGGGGGLLTYCAASAGTCDEYIGRVQFNTIDNTTGCNLYTNYTSMSTLVNQGDIIPITVTNGGNTYGSDLVSIWIDYNQNGTFDASEVTALVNQGGSGSYFTGNVTIPATAAKGITTMRVRMSYSSAPLACGTQNYGEVEDYAVLISPSFITSVIPATGVVATAGQEDVEVTFSATGVFTPAGTYNTSLVLNTNDLAHASVNIPCTMIVTVPGSISGTVTDGMTNEVLQGVLVTAGSFQAMTDDNGVYMMTCDAGNYDVVFNKIGYQQATVPAVIVTSNNTTIVDAQLYEMPYAPSCASAIVNATDTQCDVTWCVPMGPYEMLYDDGTAENFAAWEAPGNLNAVKFTPVGYPATVVGGLFFVGDGSFPVGGDIIGSTFVVRAFDDDGAGGLPGTQVGDSVLATVTAPGWVTVTGLNSTFTAGSFYLAMEQNTAEPDCAPIGVDETQPKAYKSYSKFATNGGEWVLSAYQDFMMHAIVSGPVTDDDVLLSGDKMFASKASFAGVISQHAPLTLPGFEMAATITSPEAYAADAVHHYRLSRFPVTDPNVPTYGTGTLLSGDITANSYIDGGTTWANLAQGWYAYGIKAVYPNGQESDTKYTNIVGHKMTADVTINVQLVCGFVPATGAQVQMIGLDYPNEVYSAIVPASGTVAFNVWKGNYTVDVRIAGYVPFVVDYPITGPRTIDVMLEDIKFAPRNLYVDGLTLVATWDPPLISLVDENFEGTFPPSGWQNVSNGVGWFTGTSYSGYFEIPAHDGKFAECNDDMTNDNECCSYLITPALNLSAIPGFVMTFDSYFSGAYTGIGTVELSEDGGANWMVIQTMDPATAWSTFTVDLSAYSGPGGLTSALIAFHYNDNNTWADAWAVDNVSISAGTTPPFGYGVFLDGALSGNTTETTYTFDPTLINYGQTYEAGVKSLYCSGYSEPSLYTFTSTFLFPPINLQGSSVDHAAVLTWEPPLYSDKKAVGMTWAEYVAKNNLTFAPHEIIQTDGRAPQGLGTQLPPVESVMNANSKAWACDAFNNQMVTFNLDNPGTFTSQGASTADFVAAGSFVGGIYYGCLYGGSPWFSMDTTSGTITNLGSTADLSGCAYDLTTSTMYGVSYAGGVYTIDLATGAATQVASTDPGAIDLACDNDGNLYAINISTDEFGSIDKASGAWTTISSVGFDASYAQGMSCDHSTNTIYWAAFNATAMAGQLYSIDIATGAPTLIGNFPFNSGIGFNTEVDGMAIAAAQGGGGGGGLDNLVSYVLYRDGSPVAEIPKEELEYWDVDLEPSTYCYDITAKYDLTPYGFPGAFGESMKEGTACVDVFYGFGLPFIEDWTTGTFDLNSWTAGPNWVVDGQLGNPYPTAKFKWDPILHDYASTLESWWIDGTSVTTTTPYKIWFDFDVLLNDRLSTTEEKLAAEVWNGSYWQSVAEFTSNGSFDWATQHIDITSKAKDRVFKIRFNANGVASNDIYYWLVDNVHIYLEYMFNPALNLVTTPGAFSGTTVNDNHLTWQQPVGGSTGPVTLLFEDMEAYALNSYLAVGNPTWFTTWSNAPGTGEDAIIKNTFSHSTSKSALIDETGGATDLVLKLGNKTTGAYTLSWWNYVETGKCGYYNIQHMEVPGTEWAMEVYFRADGTGELLAGSATATTFTYPKDAWFEVVHLIDLDNDDIKLFVDGNLVKQWPFHYQAGLTTGTKQLGSVDFFAGAASGTTEVPAYYLDDVTFETIPSEAQADAPTDLTGYNVYRRQYIDPIPGTGYQTLSDWAKINTTLVVPTEYWDNNLANNCYDYYVTAVYTEGESAPSNIDAWNCIVVGVNNTEAADVRVYPNPATTYVNIDLTKDVKSVVVYNALGSVVMQKNITGESTIILQTTNYAAGAYNVKFVKANGDTFSRKFVVVK